MAHLFDTKHSYIYPKHSLETAEKILTGKTIKSSSQRPTGYFEGLKSLIDRMNCNNNMGSRYEENHGIVWRLIRIDNDDYHGNGWEQVSPARFCDFERKIITLAQLENTEYLPILMKNVPHWELVNISDDDLDDLQKNLSFQGYSTQDLENELNKQGFRGFRIKLEQDVIKKKREIEKQRQDKLNANINTMEWSGKNVL